MGMGHRVYKAKDPRLIIFDHMLKELSEKKNDDRLYQFLHKNRARSFRSRMETKGKPIYPNVDFVSGSVYAMLGIPRCLFIPIFAVARMTPVGSPISSNSVRTTASTGPSRCTWDPSRGGTCRSRREQRR